MRRFFVFALLASLLTTSCNETSGEWNFPDTYAYATVMAVDDSESESDIYFKLDSKESILVTENVSNANIDKLVVGSRVIIGVTLTKNSEQYDFDYDYTAKLYDLIKVMEGESKTVMTEEEDEAIEDNQLLYVATDITVAKGYLNMFVGFVSEDDNIENVRFYLVENKHDNPESTYPKYLNLELRFDRTNDQCEGSKYEKYLSFNLDAYRDKLIGMDGIMLRLKTQKSGIISVKVNSKYL